MAAARVAGVRAAAAKEVLRVAAEMGEAMGVAERAAAVRAAVAMVAADSTVVMAAGAVRNREEMAGWPAGWA